MANLRLETPAVKAVAQPVRPQVTLAFDEADAVAGPIHGLASWWLAVEARDFRAATRLARELRARWRVSVCLVAPRGGPR